MLAALVLGVSAGLSPDPAGAAEAKGRPHIVLIVADDLGWHDVGYHGSEIATPHLDRLAADGAKLEQLYVNPLCSATRASLLIGRHSFRMGLQGGIIKPWAQLGLPPGERTLADALHEAGYATHFVGKWHLAALKKEHLPLQRGFDHDYGLYTGSIDYFSHETWGRLDWHRDGKGLIEEGYATTLLGREAVRVIEQHDPAKPLFLLLAFNAPHRPLQAPQAYLERNREIRDGNRRTYAAMVSSMDDEIGRVVGSLQARGMLESTLIVFLSDNGGARMAGAQNRPYRAGKGKCFEGGVRVPAIVHWRGTLAAGQVVDQMLHVTDLYPTLLGRAGGSLEQALPLDGRDSWPTIALGSPSPHRELLIHLWPAGGALRQADWKLVITKLGRGATPSIELFDLARDPHEQHDLASAEPERLGAMLQRFDAYRAEAAPARSNPRSMPADFELPQVWGVLD